MKRVLTLAMIALLAFTGGCQMGKEPTPPPKTQDRNKPTKPAPAPPKEEKKNLLQGNEITDKAMLAWRDKYKQQRGVFIEEFGEYRTLLISEGEQKTGGYAVTLKKAAKVDNTWTIEYSVTRPNPGDVTTQAITYPHVLLAVKKDNNPVKVFELNNQDRFELELTDTPNGEVALSQSFIVELPKSGDTLSTPLKIKGLASVFEGAFLVFIEDGHNRLAEQQVQTAGAPAWGKFELDIPFQVPTNPAGSVIFAYGSAATGEIIEELIVPIKFKQ